MKRSIIVCLAGMGVVFNTFGTNIGKVTGIYEAPSKVAYSYGECQFTSSENDAIIIVPEVVKKIDHYSFTGPRGAYSSGNMGWLYYYDAIAYAGISNIFFKGDCPTYDFTTGYLTAHILYNTGGSQFQKCTVWYVEGREGWLEGWENGWQLCGGSLKPGAALAMLHPHNSSYDFTPYYEGNSITITTPNATGVIHYTTDGGEPTVESSVYTAPINISGVTTVKAMVIVPSYPFTVVNSCSYRPKVKPLTVSSRYNTPFYYSDQDISLTTETEGAIIRYTLDGTEPTLESHLYEGPFNISETTTVIAKAFKDDYFESDSVTNTYTRMWNTVATPEITPRSMAFDNASQVVSIECDTSGATILFTTDGSSPAENGREYRGNFSVYESSVVRAIARKHDYIDSNEATVTLTRAEGLSEAVNLYGYLMETDENKPWTVVTDVSHYGVSCVRSGAIGHGGTTWVQTSVRKAGTVSFWWKAACEEPEEEDGETYWYDYGSFLVDGVVKAQIAGNDTGWQFVSVDVPSGGKHTLRWEYTKDDATTYSPDCIWLDQVQWIPADGSGHTLTTPDPVPYSWLSSYGLGLDSDFESAAKQSIGKQSGNGRAWQVWQDYVAGTDPTNVTSAFTASIEMKDGMPLVTWSPNLNSNGEVRVYTVMGKEKLTDAVWQSPTNSTHRFFKVKVELP